MFTEDRLPGRAITHTHLPIQNVLIMRRDSTPGVFMAVRASLSGIHARSEKLVQATRDHDRGRIGKRDLERAWKKDVDELVALQRKLKVEPISDGQLRYHDLFRPFAENAKGAEVGPLTRYFDNNTFYKQPLVSWPLVPGASVLKGYVQKPTKGAWKAFLPSPYAFAKLAEDRHYGSSTKLIAAFGDLLAHEAKHLKKAGFSWIQFTDPAICVYPPDHHEMQALRTTLGRVVEGAQAKTVYHTQFGNADRLLPVLDDLPVDYIGVDLYQTPIEALRSARLHRGLQAGVVDGRSSVIETPSEISDLGKQLLDLGIRDLVLSPNCELEFVPRVLADKKLANLAAAASRLARVEVHA